VCQSSQWFVRSSSPPNRSSIVVASVGGVVVAGSADKRFDDDGAKEKLMSDTELQIAKQKVSEQRMLLMKQQTLVWSLRRVGGRRLEDAKDIFHTMREELFKMESQLERLVLVA
jgi:hypothetical protein